MHYSTTKDRKGLVLHAILVDGMIERIEGSPGLADAAVQKQRKAGHVSEYLFAARNEQEFERKRTGSPSPGHSETVVPFAAMKTLLVLEDDSSLMMVLRLLLEQYRLIEASTAEQALRLFLEHGRQVDLLLADVTLPTSSGIQVALLLRSTIPKLPVILISGYPMSAWSDRNSTDLERLGTKSVAILQKPFQGKALSDAVSVICL
jgi:CheY-like chemotaxis protein